MGKYTTAILLLAGVLVIGAAGAAALAASHEDTRTTLAGAGEETPGVVVMGEEMQSALMTALPWIALIAVPLFIIGLFATHRLVRNPSSSRSRRGY